MFERTINLIGIENYNKLKKLNILLVGIGGVGSFVFESLIRIGIENITIIDYDTVSLSNINRQLVATKKTLGKRKIDVAKDHVKEINENIKLKLLDVKLTNDNINILEDNYDYIIDACDSLEAKISLIKFAKENNIKIISSMGMGNRVDPTKIKISKLNKTINDPLAKKIRSILRKDNIKLDIPVVFSEELPLKKDAINSLVTVPSVAGIYITSYIVNNTIKLS